MINIMMNVYLLSLLPNSTSRFIPSIRQSLRSRWLYPECHPRAVISSARSLFYCCLRLGHSPILKSRGARLYTETWLRNSIPRPTSVFGNVTEKITLNRLHHSTHELPIRFILHVGTVFQLLVSAIRGACSGSSRLHPGIRRRHRPSFYADSASDLILRSRYVGCFFPVVCDWWKVHVAAGTVKSPMLATGPPARGWQRSIR